VEGCAEIKNLPDKTGRFTEFFLSNIQKTTGLSSLQLQAGIGTLPQGRLPRFRRAFPSTFLDKLRVKNFFAKIMQS
jgi:hypothetical protein